MKPRVIDIKCGANKNSCKVLKICPVNAISYIEVEDEIKEKKIECEHCNCGCNCDTTDCGRSPFGRIVIDENKCTECGICAEECCGNAIEME